MKFNVSGSQIRAVRGALGLDGAQFAAVLAVHPGTIRRWEAHHDQLVAVDGVAAEILERLIEEVESASEQRARRVGEEIARALLVGTAAAGLFVLLKWLLDAPED
ncbi:MAG: hypothetical protein AAFX79_10325 [Planctomycetota bacterium]